MEGKNAGRCLDQALLEKYTEYLLNPHILAELKANYQLMVATLQVKIFKFAARICEFTSPPPHIRSALTAQTAQVNFVMSPIQSCFRKE